MIVCLNSIETQKNRAQDWNLFDVGAFALFLVTLNLLGWVGNRQTEVKLKRSIDSLNLFVSRLLSLSQSKQLQSGIVKKFSGPKLKTLTIIAVVIIFVLAPMEVFEKTLLREEENKGKAEAKVH